MFQCLYKHWRKSNIFGIAHGDAYIALQHHPARPFDRTFGKAVAKIDFVQLQETNKPRQNILPFWSQEIGFWCCCMPIPWANHLAVVTAIDTITHHGSQLARDIATVLDG